MHGLVTLFLEVIALATILLLIELVALIVLAMAKRMIMVSIVSMTVVGLSGIAIVSDASMIVAPMATMLPVA